MADDRPIEDPYEPVPEPEYVPPPPETIPEVKGIFPELAEVLWLSLPIIITMASYTLMATLDIVMVGQHGEDELAAVGPANGIFFLVASLMMGTLAIINSFVAQSSGRGEPLEAPKYAWQGVYISVIWGVVALLLSPLSPRLFAWAGHPMKIQENELLYFQTLVHRILPMGIWMSISAFYQSTKNPKIPMIVGITGNLVNLAGNYVLIFGKYGFPEWGIRGAAVATVIAQYFQAALMLWLFFGAKNNAKYQSRSATAFSLEKILRIVRYGTPAGISWMLENASWALFVLKIVGTFGKTALAAHTAAMQVVHMSFMPIVGLNIGVQAIIGHHIGKKDFDGAARRTYSSMLLAMSFMMTMGAIFIIFRHDLIRLFLKNGMENSNDIVQLGGLMLVYAAIFQVFDAIAIVSHGGLKGAGDTFFPMVVQIALSWLFFIPLAQLFAVTWGFGIPGAWFAMTIHFAVLAAIIFWRFRSNKWREINIFKKLA